MKDRFEIDGWGKDPNLPKAREMFREMIDTGCNPDLQLMVFAKQGGLDEAIEIVRGMNASGCMPTTFIVLVHTYGVEDRIEDAVDSFLEIESNGIKADLIGAFFVKLTSLRTCTTVLHDMNSKGVSPNSRTCNIILNSLIDRGETDEAYSVFRKMIKLCDPDADTYTMMIKMFCERDKIEKAMEVLKFMSLKQFFPSMHTYSVLINGLCEKGNASKASVLMEEMIEKGIRIKTVAYKRRKRKARRTQIS